MYLYFIYFFVGGVFCFGFGWGCPATQSSLWAVAGVPSLLLGKYPVNWVSQLSVFYLNKRPRPWPKFIPYRYLFHYLCLPANRARPKQHLANNHEVSDKGHEA